MKRLICSVAALATLFLAACQRETLEPVESNKTVSFKVEAPAAVQTKAMGDGFNVNQLIYEVWLTKGENQKDLTDAVKLYQSETELKIEGEGEERRNVATVTVDLLQDQNYTVLFWAQVENAGAYKTEDLRAVTYSKALDSYAANDESLAAFYAVEHITDGAPATKDVVLTRPFAQLNLGTTNSKAENDGTYTIDLYQSRVIVSNVPTIFNVANSAVSETSTMTFKLAAVPSDPATLTIGDENKDTKKEYQYAGMNYLFGGNNVTVEYDIVTKLNGTTEAKVNNIVPAVPLRENFRTNIVGNLLTSTTDYEIVVDADFSNPEIVIGQNWSQTGNYKYAIHEGADKNTLKEVLAHAEEQAGAAVKSEGPVVTIELEADVYWETGGAHRSTPLLTEDSPISKITINGNRKTLTATGAGVGSLRLANGALLELNNVNVVDETKSYNENAWEFTYLEFAGNLAFSGCTFNNGVQFLTEDNEATLNAEFVDCHFITNEESVYAVWVSDGITAFTNCVFEGTRGLKVHEAYGSEVVSVLVDGCTFDQLTKKPGIAIGDLNAETSVTIKNSTFNRCQAGEQNNYMYETDTNVNAFNFVLENNTVIPSGDGVIDQGDGSAAVATTTSLEEAINSDYTTIKLAEGTYVIPSAAQGKTLTFIGTGDPEDTKIATNNDTGSYEGCNYALDGSTVVFENISINTPSTTYIGYARCNATYKNCVINGTYTLYGNSVFEDCTFNVSGDVYNIWTWGAKDMTFKNCTFNSDGKALLFYQEGTNVVTLNVENCVFNDKGALTSKKAAIELGDAPYGATPTYNLKVSSTIVNGYEINDEGTCTGTTLWGNKNSMPVERLNVQIDDLTWIGGCIYKDAEGNVIVNSAEGLTQAANYASKVEGTTKVKITKDLVGDATIAQAANTTIHIDGQNHSYKGVITVDGKSATYTTAGLTIKDLNFDAETISADACIRLGIEHDTNTRYTCNVTVEGCTFNVPSAVGVKSYTGGDKNLTIKNCTAAVGTHSLVQAKGIDDILVENCKVYSKNGLNFNNSTDVVVDNCTADVKGYAVRFGESSGGSGAAEVYSIKNSTLKSANDDGDAVIILRGTADNSTLTIENTTLEGNPQITNTASNAKVTVDGGIAATPATVQSLVNTAEGGAVIKLLPGEYGTIVAKSDITIVGTEGAIVGCVNLNGADGLTLKNIKFDAARAEYGYNSNGTKIQPANIITRSTSNKSVIGARNLVIDACNFTGRFINGGVAIAFTDQGITQSGNITVKGCTFETSGGYSNIYTYYSGYGEFIIEKNVIKSELVKNTGPHIYLGKYMSNTPVVIQGNTFNCVRSSAWLIQEHSSAYTVSINDSANTFVE